MLIFQGVLTKDLIIDWFLRLAMHGKDPFLRGHPMAAEFWIG